MNSDINKFIKKCIESHRIAFKKHALIRSIERSIPISDIIQALKNGESIEYYLEDKPLPSFLILGYLPDNNPLHIVIALDKKENYVWIITVYIPDETKWDKNFKRRK